jgi:hypothetical protein
MTLEMKKTNPDLVLGEGSACGFDWVVMNNGSGYRCGYVRIPVGHPWHGKEFSDEDGHVHGGITYVGADTEDGSQWIGFDCMHGGDAADPMLPADGWTIPAFPGMESVIRTQEFVENECRSLCEQAREAEIESQGVTNAEGK